MIFFFIRSTFHPAPRRAGSETELIPTHGAASSVEPVGVDPVDDPGSDQDDPGSDQDDPGSDQYHGNANLSNDLANLQR